MRFFTCLVLLFSSGSAFAVDLKYSCDGLWAAGGGIFKAKAEIIGSFSPDASKGSMNLSLSTGANLFGIFQGGSADVSTGTLVLQSGNRPQISFSMSRLGLVENSGFTIEGDGYKSILECKLGDH